MTISGNKNSHDRNKTMIFHQFGNISSRSQAFLISSSKILWFAYFPASYFVNIRAILPCISTSALFICGFPSAVQLFPFSLFYLHSLIPFCCERRPNQNRKAVYFDFSRLIAKKKYGLDTQSKRKRPSKW